jgi:hypothetical protein
MPFALNRRLTQLVVGVFAACATAPLPAYGDTIVRHGASTSVLLVVGFGLIVGFVLAITLQQIARLAACKLIGWDIYLIAIGPLLVRCEPFAARLARIPGVAFTGWVMAVPPSPEKLTKWRETLFNLAGMVTNLICAAAATAISFIVAPRDALLAIFVVSIGMMSLAMAFPRRKLTYLKYATLSDGTVTSFGVARLKGVALCASGIAPEQWNPALVATLEAGAAQGTAESDANAMSADITLYERYLDRQEYEKARAALDRAISRTPPSERMWDGLCIENAFFSAFVERNIQGAQEALAQVEAAKRLRHYPYRRASAAIAIAQGDGAEALRLLRGGPYRGSNPFLRRRYQPVHLLMVSEAQRLVS